MAAENPLVLVIDDNTYLLEAVSLRLPGFGFEVMTAASVEEAITAFWGNEVDAVLLDLFLPGFVGHTLLKEFKEHRPDVPVIVISGTQDEEDRRVVLEHGADGFLAKPLTIELLAEELTKALE